jgi:hypothetical protein
MSAKKRINELLNEYCHDTLDRLIEDIEKEGGYEGEWSSLYSECLSLRGK